jgi:hypothetical protein
MLHNQSCNLHIPCRFFHRKCSCLTTLEELLSVDPPEELNQFCDTSGPARLVTSSEPGAVVAMTISGLLFMSRL